jgi:hypothetical protein
VVEVVVKGVVNVWLEGTRGVIEPKGHNEVFILTITSIKGRFLLVTFFHLDSIKSSNDIKFAKILSLR